MTVKLRIKQARRRKVSSVAKKGKPEDTRRQVILANFAYGPGSAFFHLYKTQLFHFAGLREKDPLYHSHTNLTNIQLIKKCSSSEVIYSLY